MRDTLRKVKPTCLEDVIALISLYRPGPMKNIDRFANVGPLLPQNFQLVDVSKGGDQMKVIYDMPMGVGEPHYAQTIKADKIKAFESLRLAQKPWLAHSMPA